MNKEQIINDEGNWLNSQLSFDIWNKKYRLNNENWNKWLDRVSNNNEYIKKLIQEKKFLFAGRILANRGTKNGTYSNCYSRGFTEDTLEDIMQTATDLTFTYKAHGGQGVSLSKIRPKNAPIKNGLYKSDGIIPWMRLFNTVTESISQGGARKGALMLSLDITHKDAKEFITVKDNLNEITHANLSLEIDDEFMKWVENGVTQKAIKRKYDGGEIEYIMNPIELYGLMIKYAWKRAEPGVLFVDKLRNYNMLQYIDEYQIDTTNPCRLRTARLRSNSMKIICYELQESCNSQSAAKLV